MFRDFIRFLGLSALMLVSCLVTMAIILFPGILFFEGLLDGRLAVGIIFAGLVLLLTVFQMIEKYGLPKIFRDNSNG